MSRSTWLRQSDEELLADCEVDRFRASGPGGQKRNKTESAIRLRHRPSGLAVRATESRSQHKNRAAAIERLRLALAIELRESSEALDAEALAAVREAVRRARFAELDDLSRLLDMIADAEMSLRDVADRLELTSAAVARALRGHDEARRWINQERAKLELGPLR